MYDEVPPLSINMLNNVGETALHYAAKSGNLEVVYPLVRRWIDLSIVSEQGTASEVGKNFNQGAVISRDITVFIFSLLVF
jgi:ankyrin repeat protein